MFFENENIDNISDSDSLSILEEDAVTYTGVKSVEEEQTIPDTNNKPNNKNNNLIENNKNEENNKNDENEKLEEIEKEDDIEENEENKEDDMKNSSIESYNSEKNSSSENFSDEDDENNNKKKIEKVNTVFEWDEGGKNVYVTGSFCNWKQFFIMTKNEQGIFSLTLNLPRGIHEYKFKVDKEWKCSEKSPKHDDGGGNINNYIDTRKNENSKDKNKKNKNNNDIQKYNKKVSISNNDSNLDVPKTELNFCRKVSLLFSQKYYSTYFPLKDEMKSAPYGIPGLYKIKLELNKEKNMNRMEWYNENEEYSMCSDTDLKNILAKGDVQESHEIFNKVSNLMNIHYNHLHSKETILQKTMISSVTTRYRFKNTTFLYYKPTTKIKKIPRKKSRSVHVKK